MHNNRAYINMANSHSYSKSKEDQSIEKNKIIQNAISSGNIISYFQPIINNQTQKIEKYESLMRLIDNNTMIPPSHFLKIYKKGKYYTKINMIVLENSFKALTKTTASITINLSLDALSQSNIREKFLTLLIQNSIYAHRVVLELLEDEYTDNTQRIKAFLKNIKSYGVKIALDDFGTGHSSFDRIIEYQPDFIKIDGKLIKNIENCSLSYSIVESIVLLAKKTQLQTIAEYVENEAIYHILCDLGVDYSQGYYFGKPQLLT